ncbi:MAG: VCBS repeat-containing protein [Bacteroidetes bacterium]|nr:MAG: VCBS repeat-containing protein [Bacteroidota bacterium]
MCRYLLVFFALLPLVVQAQAPEEPGWTYIQIDDQKGKWGDWDPPDWLRYFGLDMGDVDRDGDLDVLSGRYIYHNPGGTMEGTWPRTTLPENVDGLFILDVDGDAYADVIAQALPNLWWFEATDAAGTQWTGRVIGTVPATSHTNSQGFERGQLVPGGREEFVIAGDGDVYLFEIPDDPLHTPWPHRLVGANTSDEGIGLGDLDGDGDLDVVAGRRPDGEDEPMILVVFSNPGDASAPWAAQEIGISNHPIDRVEVADLNGDGRADIIVAEERWPGEEPDGNLFWYEQPASGVWIRHHIVTQYSMNNLDVADLDGDGDVDLITAEHKGPRLELQLWRNDGTGTFTKLVLDTGKENHLGTQLADLDGDGDLDLVGAGWDQYRFMHVWRNDTGTRKPEDQ